MPSSPHTSPFMSSWLTAEDDDDGWDLYAVVRSCRPASAPAAALPPPAPFTTLASRSTEALLPSRRADLKPAGNSLHELCKPLLGATQPRKFHLTSTSASPAPRSQAPRSKRRKNQQKRMVCQVVADALSGDLWAWRKYGQKPIKGSPFPRGYYRCSSSKGCLARKQVERSRTDAGMFVITYSGEHNHPLPTHRNSLAGSTRQKFPASGEAGVGLSPNTPLLRARKTKGESTDEEEEGDEGELDELLVEDMEVVGDEEVLFMGFEEFEGSSSIAVDGFLEWDGGLGRNEMEKAMHD